MGGGDIYDGSKASLLKLIPDLDIINNDLIGIISFVIFLHYKNRKTLQKHYKFLMVSHYHKLFYFIIIMVFYYFVILQILILDKKNN